MAANFILLLSSCVAQQGVRYPTAAEFSVHGIDVSKYQGQIDWIKVQRSGIHFAWIKATEGGDHKDEAFDRNWQGARDAGILRGAYHFVYWCRPADQQVAWFKQNVPRDPLALPPVLDVEWVPKSKTCPKMPPEIARMMMQDMLVGMEAAYGKKPIIYTTVDFYNEVLSHDTVRDTFKGYPVWVRSVKHHPRVRYPNQHWHFWQHTAVGEVPGIAHPVDKNVFRGTLKQLYALATGLPLR